MAETGEEYLFQGKHTRSSVEKYLSDDSAVTVIGSLYQKEEKSYYQILYLKNNSIYYQDDTKGQVCIKEPYLILLDKKKEPWKQGNVLITRGKLSFFEGARNPGNFSEKNYYAIRKIHAKIHCDRIECVKPKVYHVRDFLYNLRKKWSLWLVESIGEKDGGILSAMLLGEKQLMDPDIKELYQVNGMAHILAISGLHLSFIGLGFYQMVRRASGSYLIGGIVGMSFLLLYIMMIGTTVSAVRAVVMFCIRVGADMSGRVYDALTSLSVAAVVVILWRPLSFYDAGFQLSFGAFLAILFLYPMWSRKRDKSSKAKTIAERYKSFIQAGKDGFILSISIQMITLPVILWHYFEVPLYAVLLNIIVIPLMSVVLGFGFAGSILGVGSDWLGGKLLIPCQVVLRLYNFLCDFMEKAPGQRIVTGRPRISSVLVYYVLLILFVLVLWNYNNSNEYRIKETKKYICGGDVKVYLILLAAIITLGAGCPVFRPAALEVTYLDVGQGDCAFVRAAKGPCFLIDGGSSDVSRVGKYRIEPFLKSRGVAALDYVFLSHGDYDHVGGILEMIEEDSSNIRIRCLVFPEQSMWDEKLEELYVTAREHEIPCAQIVKGQRLTWNEERFTWNKAKESENMVVECLGPERTTLTEIGNETSMILGITYGDMRFLFVGDCEGAGETNLIHTLQEKTKSEQHYDVLKVAHHGSKNSSSKEFLDVVRPRVGIISAGKENRYGHPHQETLDRLKESGCIIHSTKEEGAVVYTW